MKRTNEDIRGEAFGNGSFEQRKRTKKELGRPAARHARRERQGMTPVTPGQGWLSRKGAGRMPWHQEPTKDAISCDKPRGAANGH